MAPRVILVAGAGVAVLALVVSLAATGSAGSGEADLAKGPAPTPRVGGAVSDGTATSSAQTLTEAQRAEQLRARQARVDEAERAALEEARRDERRQGWRDRMANNPRAAQMRERMLARYDLDGDGELSEEEEAAMRAEFEERRAQQMAQLRGRMEDVWGGEVPLTDEELAQYMRLVGRDIGREMRSMAQGFDADGDGRLSENEWQDARPAQQAYFEQLGRDFVAQNDRDGDGALNDIERQAAAEGIRGQLAESNARRTLDTDRDGQFSQSETSQFMTAFQSGSAQADLDGDGVIGSKDMDLFMKVVNDR